MEDLKIIFDKLLVSAMVSAKVSAIPFLYLILDLQQCKFDVVEFTESACNLGLKFLQLRAKNITDSAFFSYAKRLKELLYNKQTNLIINDRLDIALATNADGLHLGQDDLPLEVAKRLLPDKIVGISCHDKYQIDKAKDIADYISVGPIYKSPTKKELQPTGVVLLSEAVRMTNIPVVAIGGITKENVAELLSLGASGIAVASAVLSSSEPLSTLKEFLKLIERWA